MERLVVFSSSRAVDEFHVEYHPSLAGSSAWLDYFPDLPEAARRPSLEPCFFSAPRSDFERSRWQNGSRLPQLGSPRSSSWTWAKKSLVFPYATPRFFTCCWPS